jgi:hypothetical protein
MEWHYNEHHRHGTPLWNLTHGHHTLAHLSIKLNHHGDIGYVGFYHPGGDHTSHPVRFSTCDLDELLADMAVALRRA